ncbi:hypothetical protein RZS08_24790, partial [Arthrospira platensis SPKY1]|nr:hypothetical protein [Arthrospira platensis SPKY1]
VFNARSNLPPNGCTTRNNEWPVDCLTEFAGGRQTIAAAASYTYRFALDRSGMVIADLVADGIPQGDAASGDLQITQITVDGNPIWPKTVSAVTSNNNAVQTVPLDAIRREAVYWFGGGALGTGTPFGAILRSIGP